MTSFDPNILHFRGVVANQKAFAEQHRFGVSIFEVKYNYSHSQPDLIPAGVAQIYNPIRAIM